MVTDDQGRYLIPELPKANYKVWVRGYGLVDSQPVPSAPGKMVDLKAVVAPDAKAAAQYYPANYWYALLQFPPKSDFPGTGADGNGISPKVTDQAQWIDNAKVNSCEACHQLGMDTGDPADSHESGPFRFFWRAAWASAYFLRASWS